MVALLLTSMFALQEELQGLRAIGKHKREPARPRTDFMEVDGQRVALPDISEGTTETLSMPEEVAQEEGAPKYFLDRRDVWAATGWDADPLLFRARP
jgi:hypothetical protein